MIFPKYNWKSCRTDSMDFLSSHTTLYFRNARFIITLYFPYDCCRFSSICFPAKHTYADTDRNMYSILRMSLNHWALNFLYCIILYCIVFTLSHEPHLLHSTGTHPPGNRNPSSTSFSTDSRRRN